jgi:hypothetical protein
LPFDNTNQPADQGINGCVITIDTRTAEGKMALRIAMATARFDHPIRAAKATVEHRFRHYRKSQRTDAHWHSVTGSPSDWRDLTRESVAKVRGIEHEREGCIATIRAEFAQALDLLALGEGVGS